MHIRQPTAEEAESIRLLIVASVVSSCVEDFDESGWENFLKPNTTEAIQRRLNSPEHFSLVCEVEGELAGLITIRLPEKIDQFFVHPSFRRRGIARRLWEEARAICQRENGARRYWVKSSSMGVPVYESFGFRIAGERQSEHGISYYPMVLAAEPENNARREK